MRNHRSATLATLVAAALCASPFLPQLYSQTQPPRSQPRQNPRPISAGQPDDTDGAKGPNANPVPKQPPDARSADQTAGQTPRVYGKAIDSAIQDQRWYQLGRQATPEFTFNCVQRAATSATEALPPTINLPPGAFWNMPLTTLREEIRRKYVNEDHYLWLVCYDLARDIESRLEANMIMMEQHLKATAHGPTKKQHARDKQEQELPPEIYPNARFLRAVVPPLMDLVQALEQAENPAAIAPTFAALDLLAAFRQSVVTNWQAFDAEHAAYLTPTTAAHAGR